MRVRLGDWRRVGCTEGLRAGESLVDRRGGLSCGELPLAERIFRSKQAIRSGLGKALGGHVVPIADLIVSGVGTRIWACEPDDGQ